MADAPPVCTPPISGKPGSCLRRFTVHFRRPNDYAGQYGFDWLREEYVKPIQTVIEVGRSTPLCKNPTNLKQEYKKDIVSPITPYGQEYYPAWLALFAYIPNKKDPNISDMTQNGVTLDLRIDEIDALVKDGTKIIFKPSNKHLKATPSSIDIEEVISTGKKANGTLNYYHLKRKVNIKCHGGFLSKHEEIKVIAKLGVTEVEVGKLMLYKNNIIKHADIVLIDTITDKNSSGLLSAKQHRYYEWLMKKRAFNQSLIRAGVKAEQQFNMLSYNNDPDVQAFLAAGNRMTGSVFADKLRHLYEKLVLKPALGKEIESLSNKKTYFFFTTRTVNDAGGICTFTSDWGNMFVVFGSNLTHDHTLPHEAGHSFSLPHLFEPLVRWNKHEFYQGYTENYMDYVRRPDNSENLMSKKGFHTFFKWQWDIMRKDKSMI